MLERETTMKTITINRKEYNISAPLERAIMEVWQYQ